MTFDHRSTSGSVHDVLVVRAADSETLRATALYCEFNRLATSVLEIWVKGIKRHECPLGVDGLFYERTPDSALLAKLGLA
jgi:hypothetical protein